MATPLHIERHRKSASPRASARLAIAVDCAVTVSRDGNANVRRPSLYAGLMVRQPLLDELTVVVESGTVL